MADQMHKILVEYDLRPAYYDKFQCLAAGCRFDCCTGWRITFNKKDYLSLKRQDGSSELNENMKKALRRLKKDPVAGDHYGEFDLSGGSCPLLQADGLCSLQVEKGHKALPFVCQNFPRTENYMHSGYLERSLSPSCEGVLELLWNLPGGVDFVSDPLPKKLVRNGSLPNTEILNLRFQDIRSHCIDFLQDRRYPLPRRILLMGLALKKLSDGEVDVDSWLAHTQTLKEAMGTVQAVQQADPGKTLLLFLSNNVKIIPSVISFSGDFATVQEDLFNGLGVRMQGESAIVTVSTAPYLMAQKRFEKNFADHDFFMENLMTALFFQLHLPDTDSGEALWKSYVNFCNLYSFYRFMAVMSCREGASGDKDELFRLIVCASRGLIHDGTRRARLRDEFFQNNSATLAHMAILLCGG